MSFDDSTSDMSTVSRRHFVFALLATKRLYDVFAPKIGRG